jgi:ferric-dicitrate binding protein FerR (iron transport regulator)
MPRPTAEELLDKYAEGRCTAEERGIVERWYLRESLGRPDGPDVRSPENLKSEIWESIVNENITVSQGKRRNFTYLLAIAASVIVVLALAMFFFTATTPQADKPKHELAKTADVNAAVNKATLTLSDGSKIYIADCSAGLVRSQAGVQIHKLKDGTISYTLTGDNRETGAASMFHTIETPNGGKSQVVLPDGTKVWLNAASSLRFPTKFASNLREVDLTGEAYFEVSSNKKSPFYVHTSDMSIRVTGTQFNVMAYSNETVTETTLVEGSVEVQHQSQRMYLSPGEQCTKLRRADFSKKQVDVDGAIAWKNGLFHFDNAEIETVMKQLARWYDVEIEYSSGIPNTHFGGYISRESKLSSVLKMLELSGIRFQVLDKKIIVLSK